MDIENAYLVLTLAYEDCTPLWDAVSTLANSKEYKSYISETKKTILKLLRHDLIELYHGMLASRSADTEVLISPAQMSNYLDKSVYWLLPDVTAISDYVCFYATAKGKDTWRLGRNYLHTLLNDD